MRFILIRHAETVWNLEGRYQGRSDVALSDRGRLQARLLGRRLKDIKIDAIYSSPSSRARDTAEELTVSRQLQTVIDERLQELDFGVWDGLTRQELRDRFGEDFRNYRKEPFLYPIPGEGSLNRARLRVGEAVEDIKEKYKGTNKTVAVVTHGGILKLMIFCLLDMGNRFYRCLELGNTSVTIIDVLPDRTMLQLLNDVRHLEALNGQYVFDTDRFVTKREEKRKAMKIIAVNHITINVEDLEKSEQFYSNVLGLEKTGFIHMGDHTLTYFQLTDETRLELIRYLTPVKKADTAETDQKIYRHFCVETDDIDTVYQTCVSHGVLVRKTPSYVEKLKCSNMLIVDPNGVEIEIMQN